jgi:alkanesulfonate monooxygenase SsuD/methylene tetrahydromethanopterin reductase-like flavin-dependent oxidoreductase (luciferase family)
MKSLEETVSVVRRLLAGEMVTFQGEQVKLDQVQMQVTPEVKPPLYVGAMREKSMKLAGRIGDGVILTGMSAPAYVCWAREQVRAGAAEAGRAQPQIAVYLDVKVNPDGGLARAAMRRELASWLPWADVQLNALGIAAEVEAFVEAHGVQGVAERMPDEWLDALSAAGTPEQVAASIQRLAAAGADTVIFQPLTDDPGCLDEYVQYLMPRLKLGK